MANPRLDDLLATLDTKVDDMKGRVDADETVDQTEITKWKDEAARLQAIIDAGEATQAQIDKLAAIQAKIEAVEAANPPA